MPISSPQTSIQTKELHTYTHILSLTIPPWFKHPNQSSNQIPLIFSPPLILILVLLFIENRAGPSNFGNVISQILLCKQINPDFHQEELCSISKDSQEISKLLSEMQEFMPKQEKHLGKFCYSIYVQLWMIFPCPKTPEKLETVKHTKLKTRWLLTIFVWKIYEDLCFSLFFVLFLYLCFLALFPFGRFAIVHTLSDCPLVCLSAWLFVCLLFHTTLDRFYRRWFNQ